MLLLWWIRYLWWKEYHRHCYVAYNSYTGYLVCVTDGKEFRYDDCPAA
jgi:hypothetical protein